MSGRIYLLIGNGTRWGRPTEKVIGATTERKVAIAERDRRNASGRSKLWYEVESAPVLKQVKK